MNTISLSCDSCGAPLDAPERTRFVTCRHCGSRLEVHRTGDVFYTELLDTLQRRTDEMAEDLDVIRLQNELEQLDREWFIGREQHMDRNKQGHLHVPTTRDALLGGIMIVVFGVIWTAMATSMGAPFFFPLFGLLFIGGGLYTAINSFSKAAAYRQAESRYRARRADLLKQLQER